MVKVSRVSAAMALGGYKRDKEMRMSVVGIIGGSGLYEMEGLRDVKSVRVATPFGDPSDEYITGTLGDVKMVFLPRHGRGHRLLPSEVNYRANIYGMKKLGVERIISVSAVGSMREEIAPGHIVIVDQFFDRTKGRAGTFYGNGVVGHVEFGDPVCSNLSSTLYGAAKDAGATVHKGGTYICIEGPQFSTKAESRIYRCWGVDVIGMTNIPEAKLAREAGADEVINYEEQDFEAEVKKITGGKGCQVVYDAVGKTTFEKSLASLAVRGMLAMYGAASGPVPSFDLSRLGGPRSLFVTRPSLGAYTATREELLQRAGEVFGWVRSGKLKVRIEETFPLAKAADAHRKLEGRLSTGKLLLAP